MVTGKNTGAASKGEASLFGVDVGDDTWHKETIAYLDTSIVLPEEFIAMCGN
jgi:hypothetical protein